MTRGPERLRRLAALIQDAVEVSTDIGDTDHWPALEAKLAAILESEDVFESVGLCRRCLDAEECACGKEAA